MPKFKGPTFKSYVGDDKSQQKQSNESEELHDKPVRHFEVESSPNRLKKYGKKVLTLSRQKDLKGANSVFHDDMLEYSENLEPELHPGEMLICTALNVLRFIPYTEHKKGVSGRLSCTNFRIIFTTADPSITHNCSYQQNKLIGENDISLNSIDALFHVSKGKRKKMTDTASIGGHLKSIEIHAKDFRIHAFSFKFAAKPESKTMIHAIVHHAFPTRLELLFAFDFEIPDQTERTSAVSDSSCNDTISSKMPPQYDCIEHWNEELERLKVVGYRADTFNTGFRTCQSLPEAFVVASGLSHKDVSEAAEQYFDNRPPVWSYSCRNGASLIRMAYLKLDQAQTHIENKMIDAIQKAHHACDSPVVIDLTIALPPPKSFQDCFVKLKHICMPHNLKETWVEDNNWYSSLNESHWLGCVSSCLRMAIKVLDCMARKRKTVIVKELENRDFAPLICSLVQLLLDPHYRTLYGFQCLIQREWVAMGYRFTHRCGLLSNSDSESPLFLLFLDCVWQLLQQFPSSFQFSETYLTMLWDSVCLGLFHTFIFNSEHNRYYAQHGLSTSGHKRPSQMLSVWNWAMQYDEEHMSLCNNPLYLTHTHIDLDLTKSHQRLSSYAHKQGGLHALPNSRFLTDTASAPTDVLRPVVRVSVLQFWSYFYLRWVTPVQIAAGGSPARYLQQCILVEDIICLQHRLETLEKQKPFRKKDRRSSQLIFSNWSDVSQDSSLERRFVQHTSHTPQRQWSEVVTSSFPYTPSMTSMSFFGTPISTMLTSSILGTTLDDDDSDSDTEASSEMESSLEVTTTFL